MAINKKLIHFKTKQKFNEELANGNILDNSIVFIQDSKEINTHGTVYKSVNWSVLEEFINFSIKSRFGTANCLAVKGMTWETWINSNYSKNVQFDTTGYNAEMIISNTGNISSSINNSSSGSDYGHLYINSILDSFVNKEDIIIENNEYFIKFPLSID